MVELVKFLVTELVEKKDAVVVTENGDLLTVNVDKSDMGRVIGRQGKIAKAVRAIVKAVSPVDRKITVEIAEAQ